MLHRGRVPRRTVAQLSAAERARRLSSLKALARLIVQTFGEHTCEVIIHDLADLEHSIVWIEGNLTGRAIGGAMTNLGLELINAGEFGDLLNYTTEGPNGRIFRSSSVFLREHEGAPPWGAFCLNVDMSPYLSLVEHIRATVLREAGSKLGEVFSDEVEVTLGKMLDEATSELGRPIESLRAADRRRLVSILERKGAFQMRRAVPLVARRLGVSRYTIYNDLNGRRD